MKVKVELEINLNEDWTGDHPDDWDWQTLLDVGKGMELESVVIREQYLRKLTDEERTKWETK